MIPRLQAAKYKKSLFQSLAFKRWFFLTNAFYFNPLQVFNPPGKRLLETSCARSRARFFTVDYNAVLCGTAGPSTSRASDFSALTPDYAPGVADRFREPPERVWFGRLPELDCQLGCEPTNCPS